MRGENPDLGFKSRLCQTRFSKIVCLVSISFEILIFDHSYGRHNTVVCSSSFIFSPSTQGKFYSSENGFSCKISNLVLHNFTLPNLSFILFPPGSTYIFISGSPITEFAAEQHHEPATLHRSWPHSTRRNASSVVIASGSISPTSPRRAAPVVPALHRRWPASPSSSSPRLVCVHTPRMPPPTPCSRIGQKRKDWRTCSTRRS